MTRAGCVLALALAAAACGKRGDPQPPYPRTPQEASALRVAQRGTQLEVAFTAPSVTTVGFALPAVQVELLRAVTGGPLDKVAERRWRDAAPGERVVETSPLPAAGTLVRVAARARSRGAVSGLTPLVSFTVEPPPPAPTNLVAQLRADGVGLSWTSPFPKPTPTPTPTPTATPTTGSTTTTTTTTTTATPTPTPTPTTTTTGQPVSGTAKPSPTPTPTPTPTPRPAPAFWVYRRARAGGAYDEPLNVTPITGTSLADSSARRGESWCYVVRSVVGTTPVIVESPSSQEVCMAIQDRFAPAPPTGVAALPREGAVEVSWSPSPEPDLARYRVYRTTAGGTPTRVGEALTGETSLVDRAPGAGTVVYTVTAVDRDGNESEPSRPAEVRR